MCQTPESPFNRSLSLLTHLMLHHPHFELHQAVGEEALVLADAAVAHLVATEVQLAVGVQRAHFRVAHRGLLQNVDQAPEETHTHTPDGERLQRGQHRTRNVQNSYFFKGCLVTTRV